MKRLGATIAATSTERSIAASAKAILASLGLAETWYYDCPALVLLGTRSCLSLSGRDYVPNDEAVGIENLVTIDLSPCAGLLWGDYARSLCVEHGAVVAEPTTSVFREGIATEHALHRAMTEFVTVDTSFHLLHEFANDAIVCAGYENLDFRANVGHSIESDRTRRQFIERGNHRRIGDSACFAFELHIRRKGDRWGFKHEDIYFFDGERCAVL